MQLLVNGDMVTKGRFPFFQHILTHITLHSQECKAFKGYDTIFSIIWTVDVSTDQQMPIINWTNDYILLLIVQENWQKKKKKCRQKSFRW